MIFTGNDGLAIDGYVRDGVLHVGCVMVGKLTDGTTLNATGYRPHRILYQMKSALQDGAIGSVGIYRVMEIY